MKLVIMTKSTFFVEEDKILASLFDEGMDSLHLFKPNTSPMYSERLLTLLPEDYYRKIVVHDHYYLKGNTIWPVFILTIHWHQCRMDIKENSAVLVPT